MAAVVVGVLLLSGCTPTEKHLPVTGTATALPHQDVFSAATLRENVDAIPRRTGGKAGTMRLAKGLAPPTNKWFSGLVFGPAASPVFPFPLSFTSTATGFQAGLPTVSTNANTIFGEATTQISLNVGASSEIVSAYDDVSVTLEHRRGTKVLGHTTIAEGSPLVSYVAAHPQTVDLNGTIQERTNAAGTVVVAGRTWGVSTTGAHLRGSSIVLKQGGSVVLLPLPDGATRQQTDRLLQAAKSPLAAVTTNYAKVTNGQETQLGYDSDARTATVVVPLPHQGGKTASTGCTGASFSTIYGTVPVCISTGLTFTTPTITATGTLDLNQLKAADKTVLRGQLIRDVAALPAFATDTYYGGKSLYRAAMLLQIARQLDDHASVTALTKALTQALDTWTDRGGCRTRAQECFVYDPTLKTIVGLTTSFGSELDNDHHFHYGYFLAAAGITAQHSPNLAKKWAPVMNLLAADIANNASDNTDAVLPNLRVFDPYFSHSWASGFGTFTDGNNQESSSEAVNAWNGLALWATASNNTALKGEADWMLSGETAAALAYYVNPALTDPALSTYRHPLVSLNWGGRRDFGTWFSAAPSAIIGIQLIPMSPVSTYLGTPAGGDATHIRTLAKQALAEGKTAPLTDYALIYESLAGKSAATRALIAAKSFPASAIDNGNSRTYMLAFIMAQRTA